MYIGSFNDIKLELAGTSLILFNISTMGSFVKFAYEIDRNINRSYCINVVIIYDSYCG